MFSSSFNDNAPALSDGDITQINVNTNDRIFWSPNSPSSYDYDINCIFDGHEVNPPNVGPHLFSNDDDLPVTLNSNSQSSPNDINQQYHTLESQSCFNNRDGPPFGSTNIYASTDDYIDDLFNPDDVGHKQEIRVNEYIASDGQNHDQDQLQPSDDDRINAAMVYSSGRETIQQATTTAEDPAKQTNIKKSKSANTDGFSDSQGFFSLRTEAHFRLTISPFEYQRARYEKELDEAPRYILVANNRLLTLELSVDPDHLACRYPGFTPYLQIIRTTKPIGSNNLMYLHPYPVWLNNKEAIVYNNTLLIPVKTQTIKLDRLIMQRAKQSEIKHLDHLPIYSPNALNFIDTDAMNHGGRNRLIETYQLRWSILHFRICMINQDGLIWPTDLHCQTNPIEEFEGPEIKSLPEEVRTIMTQSSKRKRIGEPNQNKRAKVQRRALLQ